MFADIHALCSGRASSYSSCRVLADELELPNTKYRETNAPGSGAFRCLLFSRYFSHSASKSAALPLSQMRLSSCVQSSAVWHGGGPLMASCGLRAARQPGGDFYWYHVVMVLITSKFFSETFHYLKRNSATDDTVLSRTPNQITSPPRGLGYASLPRARGANKDKQTRWV